MVRYGTGTDGMHGMMKTDEESSIERSGARHTCAMDSIIRR